MATAKDYAIHIAAGAAVGLLAGCALANLHRFQVWKVSPWGQDYLLKR